MLKQIRLVYIVQTDKISIYSSFMEKDNVKILRLPSTKPQTLHNDELNL